MADTTTKGFPYPEGPDAVDVAGDIQALAEAVDDMPGVQSYTGAEITALTSGEKWAGRIVWNSTTSKLQVSNGSTFSDVDTSLALASTTPAALGVAAVGNGTTAARDNHVHAMPSASDVGAIGISLVTAKGQIIAASGSATPAAVPAGSTNGHILTWDTAEATSMKWAAAPASGIPATLLDAKGDLIVATANDTAARLAAGTNGQTLVADSSQTNGLRYIDAQTARNAAINGNFAIWQRGTSFTSANVYTADRWYKDDIGHSTISRQSSGLTGFQYSLRSQRNSGQSSTSNYGVVHSLESADALQLAGKTVTVSFYAKAGANFSPTSSVLKLLWAVGTGTDQKRTFTAALTGETTLTTDFTLTTSWQRFSVSWSVASTTTAFALQFYGTPTGTASTNDWFELTGVQVEASPVATPFEFEPYEATLRKCQRYYYRLEPGATDRVLGTGWVGSATIAYPVINFPVRMRTRPTALEQSGTAAHYQVNHSATVTACSSVPVYNSYTTDQNALVPFTVASGLTAGHGCGVSSANASAYLAWSAEL